MIGETARTPEREYAFRHSLTQDATYGTILLRRRRELHRRVGEVFEELYANRIEAVRSAAGAPLPRGRRRRAHAPVRDGGGRRRRPAVRERRGGDPFHDGRSRRPRGSAGPTRRSSTSIRAAAARSSSRDGSRRPSPTTRRWSRWRRRAGSEPPHSPPTWRSPPCTRRRPRCSTRSPGRALCERTIALARDLDDRAAESKALWNLMTLNVFSGGDPREAVEAGEASLAIARELDAREQMAFTLNDLWRPYAAVTDLKAARACLEESRPLWRELENLPDVLREPLEHEPPCSRSRGRARRPSRSATSPTGSRARSGTTGASRIAC